MKRTSQYIVNPYRGSGYEAFLQCEIAQYSAMPSQYIARLCLCQTPQYHALAQPQYKLEREARPFTIHYSLFTFHCLEPRSKQTCLRCRCISVHSHAHALHALRYRAFAIRFHALPLLCSSLHHHTQPKRCHTILCRRCQHNAQPSRNHTQQSLCETALCCTIP